MKTKTLTATRTHVASLKAEINDIYSVPESKAETASYWRDAATTAAAGRARSIAHHLAARGDGAPLTVPTPRTGEPLDLLPVLAALFGADRLIELLAPHLDALPAGLSAAERSQRLAELDAALLDAEHTEMDLIQAAEAAGVPFTWRADMSPAVVLRP